VFIDDATGRLMNLRFSETESAFDYMLATREYLNEHGKPIAFYSDKHSIFRVNQEKHKQVGQTQYGRVQKELAIELIRDTLTRHQHHRASQRMASLLRRRF
jgi:hypothetical protein